MDTTPANELFHNKLVCINYPGYVENVDKMMLTLGGLQNIEQTVGTPQKKLELKFKPENLTAKPSIAEKETRPGILLKVTVPNEESQDREDLNGGYKYEVEGVTALTFNFKRMNDFQYVPLVTKDAVEHKDSPLEYIFDKIVPPELPDIDWFLKDEEKNMAQFILPCMFTKGESTQNKLHFPRPKFYDSAFQSDSAEQTRVQKRDGTAPKTIQASKYFPVPRRQKSACKAVTILDREIPTEPYKSSLTLLNSKTVTREHYEALKAMFEERPIWSKSACQYILGLQHMQIRILLPLIGYYFLTGPWRIMWARYGYDPRIDPEARKYQTFDFRIRTVGGLKLGVEAKRNYVKGEMHSKKVSLNQDGITKYKRSKVDETDFILKPNMIPPARQMFYQYCDIKIPEIEAMLTRLPPVPPGTACDPKNGWLPSSFTDQCREIANGYVTAHVQTLLDEQKELGKSSVANEEDGEQFEISDSEEESESEMYNVAAAKLLSDDSECSDAEAGPSGVISHERTKKSIEEVTKMIGIKNDSSDDDD